MNKKTFLSYVGIAAIAFLCGALLFAPLAHKNPSVSANVYLYENVGGKDMLVTSGNVMTDVAEREARNFFGFYNQTINAATNYVSFGNCTVGQTKTQLDAELVRFLANSTVAWVTTDWGWNITASYTFTSTNTINAVGAHWASTGGSNMLAVAAITQTTFNSGDNVTAVWMFTCDFN